MTDQQNVVYSTREEAIPSFDVNALSHPTLSALTDSVRQHLEVIDSECRLPTELVDLLSKTGVFRALLPSSAGGEEWEHPTWCRFIEEVSQLDGSVGWSAGPGPGSGGIVGGWLAEEALLEVTSASHGGIIAGAGAPLGVAIKEAGGVRLTGRWPFGSGVWHADWVLCGFHYEAEAPSFGKMLLAPRDKVRIIDTWSVGGMRGSASDDYVVKELFVPSAFVVDLNDAPVDPGPLYRFPITYTFGTSLGALALGIARRALEVFKDLIRTKQDKFSGTPMLDRATLQERVACAEALVRSARALFYNTIDQSWEIVSRERAMNAREEAIAQLAFRNAVDASVKAVDISYHAAGTSAIFTSNPLERCFRDIHVARQHRFASPEELHTVGAAILKRH